MKIPKTPPNVNLLLLEMAKSHRSEEVFNQASKLKHDDRYWHWDEIQHRGAPEGLSTREWWLLIKMRRMTSFQTLGLLDKAGNPFKFAIPGAVQAMLHKLDLGAGGFIAAPEAILTPETRDRYLVSSLMQEAITSSQLEGASTTREVAKEMLRAGRKPRDTSEQMILNNYQVMRKIGELRHEPLTQDLIFQLHRMVTENTLQDPGAAGRFRLDSEEIEVGNDQGDVFHRPPAASELPARMAAMVAFANGEAPEYFVHPAARAIILHFWLAYDHPFVDGNGRTARALFYWAMIRAGYWLFEFISISSILRAAPAQYGRSFLYTETDDNDLTYFLAAQCEVIQRAVIELRAYLERKSKELRQAQSQLKALDQFNHRQAQLLEHALRHPGHRYSFASHRASHDIAYQTARTDLLTLCERGALDMVKKGKQMLFVSPADLEQRLAKLESR
jgi:Fic family protein